MVRMPSGLPRWWRAATMAVLLISSPAAAAMAPPAALPPIPPCSARVWFFRVFLPGDTQSMPAVRMNEAVIGYAPPGVNFYRDVPAGAYHITVDSYGTDLDQSKDLVFAPGQQAYFEIQSAPNWLQTNRFAQRPTYYVGIPTPQAVAQEMPQTSFTGGS
jgi:hypothetical protein